MCRLIAKHPELAVVQDADRLEQGCLATFLIG
jgi:hypothetical protein